MTLESTIIPEWTGKIMTEKISRSTLALGEGCCRLMAEQSHPSLMMIISELQSS